MKSVLQTAALFAVGSVEASAEWNYLTYGADWKDGACKTGNNQSPINFNSDPATDGYPRVYGDMFEKKYSNQEQAANGFNGHTTQLNFNKKTAGDIPSEPIMQFTSKIASASFGAPETYVGQQFHFHAPSEHKVDGKTTDLEMHTVHYPQGVAAGGDKKEGDFMAAAMGILFSVNDYTAELSWAEQKIIDQFFESLAWKKFDPKKPSDAWTVDMGRYADLLNMVDTNNRWIYQGSVTTPPCAENVYWNELRTIYPVSQKHVDQFKAQLKTGDGKIYSGEQTLDVVGNRREVQAITPTHNVVVYKEAGRPDRARYEEDANKGPVGARGPGRFVKVAMRRLGTQGLVVGCVILGVLTCLALLTVCGLAHKVNAAQKNQSSSGGAAPASTVEMGAEAGKTNQE